jgi:hypothetical protein
MSMAGRVRLRVVAASSVLALAGVVLVSGARAWATAQTDARCSRVAPTAVAAPGPQHGPEQRLQRRLQYGHDRAWRSHALRVAGCSAWHEMRRHRVHHPRRA